MGNAQDSLDFFSTSSVSGATGCATAADARQAHVLTLSSTTASAAMGTAGSIFTLSGGYERRWSNSMDVAQVDNRFYGNALFEIDGLPANWNYNTSLSNSVARQIIARVVNGGLRYSNDGTTPPVTAGDWDLMYFGLMDV